MRSPSKSSLEHYQLLFEHARDIILYIRLKDGQILDANPAAELAYKYSHEELLTLRITDLRALATHALIGPQMQQADAKGLLFETLHRRKNGSIFPVEVSSLGATIGGERINLSIIRDISERKSAHKLMDKIFASLAEVVLVQDPATRIIVQCSAAAERVLGYLPEELVGKTTECLFPTHEIYEDFGWIIRSALDREGELHTEQRLCRKDGKQIFIDLSITEIIDERGERIAIVGSIHDITQRKQAELALAESERHLRALVEATPLGLHQYHLQPDGRLIFSGANPVADQILGIDNQEMIGLPIEDAFPAHRQTEIPAIYRQVSREGTPFSSEQIVYHDDRIQGVFEIHAFQTGPSRMAVFFQDITEKKKSEEALRESEEKFRTLIEQNSEGVILLNEQGQVIEWNPAQERITGISRQEALEQFVWDLQFRLILPSRKTSANYEAMKANLIASLKTGQSASFHHPDEISVQRPDGEGVIVQQTAFPIKTNLGYRIGSLMADITDRKQAELELERRIAELEVIAEISAIVRAAENRESILPVALERTTNILSAQGAAIAVLDPQDNALVFDLGWGNWESIRGARLPQGSGISDLVSNTKEVFVSEDALHDPRLLQNDWIGSAKCLLCLPLTAEEETVGLMCFGRDTPFRYSDVRLAQAIGDIVASAIHRIQLRGKTQQQLERLTALREIDQAILSSPKLDLTLEVLLEKITSLLQVDAADIMLYDACRQNLSFSAGRGLPFSPPKGMGLPVGESLAGRAIVKRELDFIPDLQVLTSDPFEIGLEILAPFTSYLAVPLVAKEEIKGVLHLFHRTRLEPTPDWIDFMQVLAGQAAIAIDDAQLFEKLQQTNQHLLEAYDNTIDGWSRVLDLRDKETEGHSRRVTELTLRLAQRLGIPHEKLAHIRRGAQLHDIGKMGIPDEILLKPGPLSESEWEIMRKHPLFALDFLLSIEFLQPALEIPTCHHEKWDGSGYPQGLKGENIPLAARIFAVVDVWDALTSDRPYRPAWSKQKTLEYMREQSGIYFDPDILKEFLKMADTISGMVPLREPAYNYQRMK